MALILQTFRESLETRDFFRVAGTLPDSVAKIDTVSAMRELKCTRGIDNVSYILQFSGRGRRHDLTGVVLDAYNAKERATRTRKGKDNV